MYLIAILFELLLNPLLASLVSLTIHRTGTEAALGSTKGIGRIGIEFDADRGLLRPLALTSGTTSHQEK